MGKNTYTWSFGVLVAIILITISLSGRLSSEPTQSSANSIGATRAITSLETPQFSSLMREESPILIDVRTPEEFATGHLKDAVNIDFYSPNFRSEIANLDPTKQYALYCRSGNRTSQTLSMMRTMGFSNVSDLKGGIVAWQQHGLSLCTIGKC